MPFNYSSDYIKTAYEGTDLHLAASSGDVEKVKLILKEEPQQYLKFTSLLYSNSNQDQTCSRATALHYALIDKQYEVAELLLKHHDCPKIINTENSMGKSILQLIVQLPDKKKALNLARLALNVENIQINHIGYHYFYHSSSALFTACKGDDEFNDDLDINIEMIGLLLKNGADPNLPKFNPILNRLADKLFKEEITSDEIDVLNKAMLLLIDNGADPKRRDMAGRTFFDAIIREDIAPQLDPGIKESFSTEWKISSNEEKRKAREIVFATKPFASQAPGTDHSPSLENTALLVNLKKERRLANQSDYDCTVLYGREQLKSFIDLAKLRFELTGKQPFQTQFIMQPRRSEMHVANGQLNFDADGNVDVFWVDSLGHKHISSKEPNKAVREIIHERLPNATFYTTDITMQSTPQGCHNIALYISERLSAAQKKKKNLFGDLEKIYEEEKREEDGFRIIPWEKCPVYTGLPKIIQSASQPEARIAKGLKEDQETRNKKNQNYEEEMRPMLVEQYGRTANITYDTKRQKFGTHIEKAYEEEYGLLSEKRLAAFTDIIERIPEDALAEKLGIKLVRIDDSEEWEIVIPPQCQGIDLGNLKGSFTQLIDKLDGVYNKVAANNTVIKAPNFLFYWAAIKVSRAMVVTLQQEQQQINPTVQAKRATIKTEKSQQQEEERRSEQEEKQPVAPDLHKLQESFKGLVQKLESIYVGLEKKSKQNPKRYERVCETYKQLIQTLNEGLDASFSEPDSFNIFNAKCKTAIENAESESKNHRGFWYQVHPVLRKILGVLATCSIIPALVVAASSKHGYAQTFFSKPKTATEEQFESESVASKKKDVEFELNELGKKINPS